MTLQLSVHNVQKAAEARGAEFRFRSEVTKIRKEAGRVAGITLQTGEKIDAPVVVNARALIRSSSMTGYRQSMKISTRALQRGSFRARSNRLRSRQGRSGHLG